MPAAKTLSTEEKLDALYALQKIDSELDQIHRLKGELPMEVADLEDEIVGLGKRLDRINEEIAVFEKEISDKKNKKKEAEALIAKYNKQQSNVKNNREFDALTKEIELQNLEVQIAEKRMREADEKIQVQKKFLEESEELVEKRKVDLEAKKVELDKIIAKTEKEEAKLNRERNKQIKLFEERLLKAYNRIRNKYKNGLAVATIERESCSGCFNKIPPQVQLEIAGKKRIIQCENCARVLVSTAEEPVEA